MSIDCKQILNQFPQLLELLSGSVDVKVRDVSGADAPQPETISFVNDPQFFNIALESKASVLVVGPKLKTKIAEIKTTKTILISPNPTYAMIVVIDTFFSEIRWHPEGIHKTAVIDPTAILEKDVHIGANCSIGPHSKIGSGTKIHSNTTIADHVMIGSDCTIFSNVTIERKCQIGNRVEIKSGAVIGSDGFGFAPDQKGVFHRIQQRGIVVLEDDVSIGSNTCIDRGTFIETRIRQGTKLDNLIQVGHNCDLGKHSVYAGGSVIAGSSIVGNHVMVGGQSAIGGHLKICDNVQIGGRSGFSSDITKPGAYSGRPIQPIKEYLKNQVLQTKLPDIYKDINRIKKHLGFKSEKNENDE